MSEREPTLRDVMARLDSIDGRLDGMATKSDLMALEQRMATKSDLVALEQRVAELIQDGTEKILDAVQRLADTKADKSPGSTPADMASAKWDPNDV